MRRDDKLKDDKGKVKFRFVEFELDGSNETLQESLRNIAAAITRGGGGTVRTLEVKSPALLNSGDDGANGTLDVEENAPEVVSPEAGEGAERPARRYPPRTPKILDIDLTVGKVNLKDFCEAKKPTSDMNKYLVIAAWFKQHGSTPEVTMDHAHTAYRHMGWHTPADAFAPFRLMKTKKYGYFGKGKSRGIYAINHVGENAVSKMKGK